MTKFIIVLVTIVLLIVFTVQNIEQVEVQLPFIKDAFRIRLVYLLFTTFILGSLSNYLLITAYRWKRLKKKKKPEADKNLDSYL